MLSSLKSVPLPNESFSVLMKVLVSKIGKESLAPSLLELLMSVVVVTPKITTCSCSFHLMRILVKQMHVIHWGANTVSPLVDILFIELGARDSIPACSESAEELKRRFRVHEMRGMSERFCIGASVVAPEAVISSAGADDISTGLASMLADHGGVDGVIRGLGILRGAAKGGTVEVEKLCVVAVCVLHVICWKCCILGRPDLANQSLVFLASLHVLPGPILSQVVLVQGQLGFAGVDGISSGDFGMKVKAVLEGQPPKECSPHESRYEVSALSLLAAKQSASPSAKVALASYALHCMKWTSSLNTASGTEGVLALLFTDNQHERLSASLLQSVPPMQRVFIALDAVVVAASALEEIGYIPGASWLFQRGILFVEKLHQPVREFGARYSDVFRVGVRRLHLESPTAIPDPMVDMGVVQQSGDTELAVGEDRSRARSVEETMVHLRQVVEMEHVLHNKCSSRKEEVSHVDRVLRVLSRRPGVAVAGWWETCVLPTIAFLIDSEDRLVMTCKPTNGVAQRLILKERDASHAVLELIAELDHALQTNKMSVTTERSCAKDFWATRRMLDQEIGKIISLIEFELLGHLSNVMEAIGAVVTSAGEGPVVLVLDNLLLSLPMESMPCLRNVCCVRGIHLATQRVHSQPLSQRSGSAEKKFVLNPNGDCESTEHVILPALQRLGWQGHSKSPTLNDHEFASLLSTSDIFLFSGHGGGEKHWSGAAVQRLWRGGSAAKAALLMGCSSAKPYGDYKQPFCTPFHYLIGGYGLVVGTLWDVLGRELDKITLDILESIDAGGDIGKAAHAARKKAKLPFLSACSLVVYVDVSSAIFPST